MPDKVYQERLLTLLCEMCCVLINITPFSMDRNIELARTHSAAEIKAGPLRCILGSWGSLSVVWASVI
jgi:hypothetical protein